MDEAHMNHALEASNFADAASRQLDDVQGEGARRAPLPWRIYLRCVFLSCIILSVLYMSYRPSLLRLSMIMSLVSPSRGDSLAWQPEPEEEVRSFVVRHTPSPAEWRLAAAYIDGKSIERPQPHGGEHWVGGRLPVGSWGRVSGNPWNWSDDVQSALKRKDASSPTPAQKPASNFRTKDDAVWAAQAGIGLDVPELQSARTVLAETAPEPAQTSPGALRPPDPGPLAPLPSVAMSGGSPATALVPDEGGGIASSPVTDMPPLSPLPDSPLAIPAFETSLPAQNTDIRPPAAPAEALPTSERTEINVFQLPPLPSTIAPESPVAQAVPDQTADSAPDSVGENIGMAGETVASPVDMALPQTAPEVGIATLHSGAPDVTASPVTLPDTVEPVAVPTTPVVTPSVSTVPEESGQTSEDPFAVGSVIVSTPAGISSQPAAIAPLEQAAPLPSIATPVETVAPGVLRPTVEAGETSAPAQASATEPEKPDWKNREITSAIPGAYLTIYPKLKFIGLCVPGQGYIRKYNQVAVPVDLDQEKLHAADGRTPYGKYYIARHLRDASGARLLLSWPSMDDARRVGLGQEVLSEVERAWQNQSLPPQDSHAGGGVALSGDREQRDVTSGGFALEDPHMEEIYTALPDGAWVFIQP